MMDQVINNSDTTSKNILQLNPIEIKEDYRRKWNVSENDFVCLALNGELLRPTLYRVGGMNYPDLKKDRYFMLIKQVEAFYSKEAMRYSFNQNNRHLEGRWCILDKNGNEKIEFKSRLEFPYILKDSCIYYVNGKCYNIETNECYGDSNGAIESTDFIFLNNRFYSDQSKKGVMKINKQDGAWEIFK